MGDQYTSQKDQWRERAEKRRRQRSPAQSLFLGVLAIAFGTAWLLDNLGVFRFRDFWSLWPVILIVVGAQKIFSTRFISGYIWGGTLALIGAALLAGNFGYLPFRLSTVWPVFIIAIGVSMLARAMDRGRAEGDSSSDLADTLREMTVFGGVKRRIDSQKFQGGEVSAMFGGVELDLRKAQLEGGKASIEANAMFGGIEIRVPEEWRVETNGIAVFGGFEDKTVHSREPDAPVLTLTGNAWFGGVSIQN
jgi:predicted membrane protein